MKYPKITKQKNGMYRCRVRSGAAGASGDIYLYGYTVSEVKQKILDYKASSGKQMPVEEITLRQAIDRYIADRPSLSPSTVRGYRQIQALRFQAEMDLPIKARINWQAAINRDAENLSPKTISSAWGLVSSVLIENGKQPQKVRLPQKTPKDKKWLTPEQVFLFLDAIKGTKVELPALLGLHSLRRSELMDVTWDDVILEDSIEKSFILVHGAAVMGEDGKIIHKETNKNSASRREVPILIPRLYELLKTMPREGRYLVTETPNHITNKISKICRENDLPEVGMHGLRHSFVSLAYHLGWSELMTMAVAGYTDFQTMRDTYTHLYKKDLATGSNTMRDFYSNK